MSSAGESLNPLLRLAVIAGVETAIRHHIRKGDNLNARDGGGLTPLMIAASRKKAKVIALLLSGGADPRLVDSQGRDALAVSENKGCAECAALLREALNATGLIEEGRASATGGSAESDVPASGKQDLSLPSSAEGEPLNLLVKGDSPQEVELSGHNGGLCAAADEGQPSDERLPSPIDGDQVELDAVGLDDWEPAPDRGATRFIPSAISESADSTTRTVPGEQKYLMGTAASSRDDRIGVQEEISIRDALKDHRGTPVQGTAPESIELIDRDEFDLDAWEAEPEAEAPEGNPAVTEEVKALHHVIAGHKAVDTDEDWDEIDTFLPKRATPVLQGSEAEQSIRVLLLRAIREGAVPESQIIEACLDDDGERNEQAERLLACVIGDIGAFISDYGAPDDTPLQLLESYDDTGVINEALQYLEELGSGWNEPLRFYQRDFKSDLLTAEEEIALGRQMETAGSEALDALARWSAGIDHVLAAAARVAKGEADVEAFSSGAEPSDEEVDTTQDEYDDPDVAEIRLDNDALAFVNAASDLAAAASVSISRTREALSAAALTRGFLTELAECASDDPAGAEFAEAMGRQVAARERMILSNLRLAHHIATKYRLSGVPFEDLVQEANIGLIKAVERFDWRKGFRFSTYGTWWIRQQISRYIADRSRVIRVPVHMHDKLRKVEREMEQLEARSGRCATASEIALYTDTPIEKVRLILELLQEPESLDATTRQESPLVETVVDPECRDPASVVEVLSLRKILESMLSELDKRSLDVLTMRFGLAGREPMTLEEIGPYYGVTRERVRQIESKALRKLSHPLRKKALAVYLEKEFKEERREENDSQVGHQTEKSVNRCRDSGLEDVRSGTEATSKRSPIEPLDNDTDSRYVPKANGRQVDRLIRTALDLGFTVEDKREEGGKLFVTFPAKIYPKARTLLRKMTDYGFRHLSGTTYVK